MSHVIKQIKTLNASELSAAARVFSSIIVKEFAKKGFSSFFVRLANESGMFHSMPNNAPIGSFFDCVFEVLKRERYRNEYVYKNTIVNKKLLGIHSLNTAVMLNEFRVGMCKADVAILNGTSTVYEIKSERDTLSRLDAQINAYRQVFARVNVIAGENHINNISTILPSDVGILLLNKKNQIRIVRDGMDLPGRTNPISIFESVNKSEAALILNELGIDIPLVPNTQMHVAMKEIFKGCDSTHTHKAMVNVLKKTRSHLPISDLMSLVPSSLHSLVLSTSFRKQDHIKLISALQTSKKDALLWV